MQNSNLHSNPNSNNTFPTEIEYSNTFGTVYTENFKIYVMGERVVNLDNNLRKVQLIKKRNYRKNVTFFAIAVLAALIFNIYKDNQTISILSAMIAMLTILISMLFVEHRFKFMIYRRYDFSEFNTDKYHSDDAQQLALLVNKKIRTKAKISGF